MRLLILATLLALFSTACDGYPGIVDVGEDNVAVRFLWLEYEVPLDHLTINGYENIPTPTPYPTPDGTTAHQNPGSTGMDFDNSRNVRLRDAESLDAVVWTVAPHLASRGKLVAAGEMDPGIKLFDPVAGEGSPFSVFYKGHADALVELLPDLFTWDTFATVAPTEMVIEGANFSIQASSPLFWDVEPDGLELRVYGTDSTGADVLIAVHDIE